MKSYVPEKRCQPEAPTSLESGVNVAASLPAPHSRGDGRSTKLLRQSPVKPKVGAG